MSWSSLLQAWPSPGEKVTLSCWLLCLHLVLIWLSKLFIEHGGLEDGWERGRIHSWIPNPSGLTQKCCMRYPLPSSVKTGLYAPKHTPEERLSILSGAPKRKLDTTPGNPADCSFSPNMFHLLIFTNKWAKPTELCQWWSLPSYYLVCWYLFFLLCALMYRAHFSKSRSIECSRNSGPFKHSQVDMSRDSGWSCTRYTQPLPPPPRPTKAFWIQYTGLWKPSSWRPSFKVLLPAGRFGSTFSLSGGWSELSVQTTSAEPSFTRSRHRACWHLWQHFCLGTDKREAARGSLLERKVC